MVTELNKDTFEDFVKEGTVLVDFYADWCGPCKVMSPIIDTIAEEVGDRAKVGKVNVDGNIELSEKFEVQSIPTIIVFKDGKEVNKFLGVTDKDVIKESL